MAVCGGRSRVAGVRRFRVVRHVRSMNSVDRKMRRPGAARVATNVNDCWGRALWGLGTAAARGPAAAVRAESLTRSDSAARVRSEWPHAMAFAALSAAEVLGGLPGHSAALSLLADAVGVTGDPPASAAWPWPAPRLSYANAAIAEAVIVAGWKLDSDPVLRTGLRMLEWLLVGETRWGHLPVVPVGGWVPASGARASISNRSRLRRWRTRACVPRR